MDFDDSVADQLIAACEKAAAALSEQHGPRASVTGESLEEFRGPFAVLFQQNAAAQSAARNTLIGALEDLTGQVRFAKTQAEQARQDLKDQQAKALWLLVQEGLVGASGDDVQERVFGLEVPGGGFAESEVRRPEVVFRSLVFTPHHWASNGGSGTSSAVPDALMKAASLVHDQQGAAERVCQNVVRSLGRFRDSCSWALSDVGAFAPAVYRFTQDDRDDALKLRQIGQAFSTAGNNTNLSEPVELSATSLALAISPQEVYTETLLKFLAEASPHDLEVASENPRWLTPLALLSPKQAAEWWATLHGTGSNAANEYSERQLVLLKSAPKVFGSLDGIPSLARVHANKLAAVEDLAAAQSELAMPVLTTERREFLTKEIEYLKRAGSGEVQIYLYDREKSRIVEMLGTPDQNTQRTITYIPGTFTSLKSFYNLEVRQVSRYITRLDPDTVAFVYKDGLFPGEDQREGGQDNMGLLDANDPQIGRDAGRQLAIFQQGMRTDPLLQGTEQIGIGHSWGYQNLTSSEIFGAHYDKSLSLSGAGMQEDWVPDADTTYSNYVYGGDGLRWAQKSGLVWAGDVPGTHDSFTQYKYDRPNRGTWLPDISPIEDHSLIASDSADNKQALRDIFKEVTD